MHGRKILVGAAIAAVVALGVSGAVNAHWDPDWDDPDMMGPGMMGGTMDPGMMGPGIGIYPDDWWESPGIRVSPHHR
jgi:hypothetical protein